MPIEQPAGCQCDGPGECPLMRRYMSAAKFRQCKHKPHYFEMFLSEADGPRRSPARQQICQHRGEVTETLRCRSCHGGGTVPIYGCAIHGRCTTRNATPADPRTPRPAACNTCDDYSAAEADSDA